MLKVRVVPTLLYRDFGLVKGVGFDSSRGVGSVMQAVKVYNMRDVDELVFLDVSATDQNREPDYALVDEIADECFMPFTVGGAVSTVEHVGQLLKVGADKVAIGTAAVEHPDVVRAASCRFGAQCIVVSIDFVRSAEGPRVAVRSGRHRTELHPVEMARRVEELGAGEILLQSVDRDGTMGGYDLEVVASVTAAVGVPVIASGGAGVYDHLVDAVVIGQASAVAAASMFHFTQQTPVEAKQHMQRAGIPVRL